MHIPNFIRTSVLLPLRDRVSRRPPDICIGGEEHPYMRRWWVIPRNTWINVYLHHFCRSDDDRALHDHPWWSISMILEGYYFEVMPYADDPDRHCVALRSAGDVTYRAVLARHRVELHWQNVRKERPGEACPVTIEREPKPCWTLFITGPKVRNWGFWCEGTRFVPWQKFTNPKNPAEVGAGCGESDD